MSLKALLILCALLYLTGIRAQMLAGWLGKERALGPKIESEMINMQ